ncbi:MAG: B12-binding domain-containing radical SAM protein [Planctomycetaceae bacterium]|nr:B12-binding domain-containing radical SAM protein [Planctomycetaceae bacterium]
MSNSRATLNVLLLYPETPRDTYWSFSHALGMIGKKASTPPLGLLTIAAMLPEDRFSLRLTDMNIKPLKDVDIEWADAIFVSSMIAHKDSLVQTLEKLKAMGKLVVSGGPYTSTAYAETANVDCFLIGEAEGIWDEFMADLLAGTLKTAYARPVRASEEKLLRDFFGDTASIRPAEEYPDVDLAPLPRFDLLDMNQYSLMPVQASRGCPVGCEFCDIWRRFGRKARNKATERLLAEFDELHRLGWRDTVFLVDDNFIGNKARAKSLLKEIIAWQKAHKYPFPLLTESTLSMADDDELLDLMEDAGFNSVFVGIETPAHESLKETRKHINTTGSMNDKVAKIQARGIQLMSGFIIGFDADPEDIADRMSECIQEMGIPQAMIGLLSALPETDLHDRLAADGRILAGSSGNNTHGFEMNFVPTRPMEKVLADYKKVLDAAYSRTLDGYFDRCRVLRSRWPSGKRTLGFLPLSIKIRILTTYLWAVIRSPYRKNALWFILETALKKPSFLVEAITLGVKGHHLWAITRNAFEVENMRMYMLDGMRRFADYLQGKRSDLGEVLARAGQQAGDDLSVAWESFKRSASANASDASDDMRAAYRRAEEVLREVEQYRQRVQTDVETRFNRLSSEARGKLMADVDKFAAELERLCASLGVEPVPVRVRV